jgi:hypothetical protein
MKANRKVVETRCSICDQGFELAETVYACPSCRAYHHTKCWDSWGRCDRQTTQENEGTPSAASPDELRNVAETPPVSVLKSDERMCPSCREVIKNNALKCRFCGTFLDTAAQQQLDEEKVPAYITSDIDKYARESIIWGCVGFLICAPVTGPIAISKGRSALKLLDQYPKYREQSSASGKAKAGIAIGVISLVFAVIALVARVSNP